MPPAPTPTSILAARGSWRAKTRDGEPTPDPVTDPKPPKGLPSKAKRVWKELASRLVATKVLTTADLQSFARYCRLVVLWSDTARIAEAKPDRANVLALKGVDEMLRRLESGFGLTPADRVGLNVQPETKDPRERFFEKRAS